MASAATVVTQRCSRCREEKESVQFGVVIEGVAMDASVCFECVRPDFQRKCRQCDEVKPLTDFGGCLVGAHRRMSICRACSG